jgi:sugar phosphate isomerase/epimerase
MYIGFDWGAIYVGDNGRLFWTADLEEVVKWATKNGFDCLEIRTGLASKEMDMKRVKETTVSGIKKLFKENGLFISALAPWANHLDANLEARKRNNDLVRSSIDLCLKLNVEIVDTAAGSPAGMHFFGTPGLFGLPHETGSKVEECINAFSEVFIPLAEYADGHGIKIAFETAGRGPRGNIAHSPYMWDKMFEAVPSKALGLSFDPSHLVWLHIGPVESIIRKYGDRVYHVDGKDCEIIPEMLAYQGIFGNKWWRYRIPGYGALNWAGIISALLDIGFKGSIDIENEDPVLPGLGGIALGRKHINQFMP